LELLQKYGANAWRMYNFQLEGQLNALKHVLEQEKSRVVACNQERKAAQLDVGAKLSRLEKQWYELVSKNAQLEAACLGVEVQIQQWKKYAEDLDKYEEAHLRNNNAT
jgi:pre-mRNA-splicing factor SPF27